MTSLHDLSCEIADHGGWEEFHQRRAMDPQSRSDRHWPMYDHHKARRLAREAEYRRLRNSSRETPSQKPSAELGLSESEGDRA